MQYDFQHLNLKALKKKYKVKPYWGIECLIATFLFVGFAPIAPGTFGTLAVYPIYYWITELKPFDFIKFESLKEQVVFLFWFFTIFFTIIGTWATDKYQKKTNTHDHKTVVIDEVVGMLLTLAISFDWLFEIATFLTSYIEWNIRTLIFLVGFIAFRYFDITKPLFISSIDQRYRKPFGVILDDILAALFASGTIFIIAKIVSFIN